MASPGAAAVAAMIRQYYITQYANPMPILEPSGVLVKATLLHAGQKMDQYVCVDTIHVNMYMNMYGLCF